MARFSASEIYSEVNSASNFCAWGKVSGKIGQVESSFLNSSTITSEFLMLYL